MKKITRQITLLIICLFLLPSSGHTQSAYTINTYYPSPYGEYSDLWLVPRTNTSDGQPCSNVGLMRVNLSNQLLYCEDDGLGNTLWTSITNSWSSNGSAIYPTNVDTNPNIYVGVGTSNPDAKLTLQTPTSSSTDYAINMTNRSGRTVLWATNDGKIGVGITEPLSGALSGPLADVHIQNERNYCSGNCSDNPVTLQIQNRAGQSCSQLTFAEGNEEDAFMIRYRSTRSPCHTTLNGACTNYNWLEFWGTQTVSGNEDIPIMSINRDYVNSASGRPKPVGSVRIGVPRAQYVIGPSQYVGTTFAVWNRSSNSDNIDTMRLYQEQLDGSSLCVGRITRDSKWVIASDANPGGHNVYVDGSISCSTIVSSSDIRLKKNIQPIQEAHQKIMQLRPVTFIWKKNNQLDFGLIAQELEPLFPEVVITDETPDAFKSISYEKIAVPLIESVKTLKQQQNEIEKRLTALEKKQK